MNSIDGDDDLRCFHGIWTNWHAPHDIGQEMYERWNIPGLVWGNLSSCKQPSPDTIKTYENADHWKMIFHNKQTNTQPHQI